MIKGLKICGISDPKTLNHILNHSHSLELFVGFITNYEKSKRFVEYEKLKNLINVDKKKINFVSVLVNPTDKILEKIKDLNFDYYQLYDVMPERTKEIITPGIRFNNKTDDQKRVVAPKQAYKNGSDWLVIGRPITKGNIRKNIQTLIDHLSQ